MKESLKKQVAGSHYKNMAIQPVEFIAKNRIPFIEGSAIKYICRHTQKNGVEDLEKAIHYLEIAKEFYYSKGGQDDNV